MVVQPINKPNIMLDTTNPTLAAIAEQLEALGVYCVGDDHACFGSRGDAPTGIWMACDDTVEAFTSKLAEPDVQSIVSKHGWLERYDSETAMLWVEK